MSQRLPRITAREIIAVLERRGFHFARAKGSHQIYRDASGRRATVSVHAGQIVSPKVLKRILSDAEMTVEDLRRELGRESTGMHMGSGGRQWTGQSGFG